MLRCQKKKKKKKKAPQVTSHNYKMLETRTRTKVKNAREKTQTQKTKMKKEKKEEKTLVERQAQGQMVREKLTGGASVTLEGLHSSPIYIGGASLVAYLHVSDMGTWPNLACPCNIELFETSFGFLCRSICLSHNFLLK